MALRQGFGQLKTEQLGGHSQEQQRQRQAPIDEHNIEDNQSDQWWFTMKLLNFMFLVKFLYQGLPCNERLKRLSIQSIELYRLRIDLVYIYI